MTQSCLAEVEETDRPVDHCGVSKARISMRQGEVLARLRERVSDRGRLVKYSRRNGRHEEAQRGRQSGLEVGEGNATRKIETPLAQDGALKLLPVSWPANIMQARETLSVC